MQQHSHLEVRLENDPRGGDDLDHESLPIRGLYSIVIYSTMQDS